MTLSDCAMSWYNQSQAHPTKLWIKRRLTQTHLCLHWPYDLLLSALGCTGLLPALLANVVLQTVILVRVGMAFSIVWMDGTPALEIHCLPSSIDDAVQLRHCIDAVDTLHSTLVPWWGPGKLKRTFQILVVQPTCSRSGSLVCRAGNPY